MNSTDQLLSEAVKAILIAAAEIDPAVSIRASGDQNPVERPYLVSFCEDGTTPHPQLRKTTLVLRMRTRADETPAGQGAAWHQQAVDFLKRNPAALHATLLPHGYQLTHFTAQSFTETPEEERGHEYDQRWSVWLKTVE